MVSQLKTLCRILVRHRFLLSAGLSAAAGIILKSTVPIPVADPLFRYAALQRPSIYVAFVWSFAIFLFTTPFLTLVMCFSLLYIHFYEEETAETLGTLPEYPEPLVVRACLELQGETCGLGFRLSRPNQCTSFFPQLPPRPALPFFPFPRSHAPRRYSGTRLGHSSTTLSHSIQFA